MSSRTLQNLASSALTASAQQIRGRPPAGNMLRVLCDGLNHKATLLVFALVVHF